MAEQGRSPEDVVRQLIEKDNKNKKVTESKAIHISIQNHIQRQKLKNL